MKGALTTELPSQFVEESSTPTGPDWAQICLHSSTTRDSRGLNQIDNLPCILEQSSHAWGHLKANISPC